MMVEVKKLRVKSVMRVVSFELKVDFIELVVVLVVIVFEVVMDEKFVMQLKMFKVKFVVFEVFFFLVYNQREVFC